ncbi:hypothetical protein B7463_g7423, partial [Scytalidium lignicola]
MEPLRVADSDAPLSHSLLDEDVTVRKQNIGFSSRQSYETPTGKNWPAGPDHVHRFAISSIISPLLDAVLILIALLFFCLGIAALCIKDRPTGDRFGTAIQEAMKLGPTIYPIIFAAITGRALKSVGRYRVERGIRLSTLWPIMNTKTIFDAALSQWNMRRLSLTASLLGLVWALSPIGGQASLRVVYITNATSIIPKELRYMDTGPLGHMFTDQGVIASSELEANASGLPLSMSATYFAGLMQGVDTKISPRDAWGNPKIPNIQLLDTSLANSSGWIEFPNTTTVESWNSLLGLPIAGLPNDGVTEFTVETSYIVLSTPSITFDTKAVGVKLGMNVRCVGCINVDLDGSEGFIRVFEFLGSPYTELINKTELTNSSYTNAQTIIFTQGTEGSPVVVTGQVTEQHVETAMRCESGICHATAVRQSTTDHRPANLTTLDYWGTFALDMISAASQTPYATTSSPSEVFITNASTIPVLTGLLYGNQQAEQVVNFSTIDPVILSQRATMLINTAVQIFLSPVGFAGNLPSSNLSLYGLPHNPANGANVSMAAYNMSLRGLDLLDLVQPVLLNDPPFVGASTMANVTTFTEVYKPDYAWVILLLLSSAVLAITGLIGLFVNLAIKAPDVFDPVMGLTYGNPYLGLPGDASVLDATDRARILGGLKVRLGDVKAVDSVGRIALGKAGKVLPISKGKLYD